jgi:hypothetical protein
VRNGPGAEPTRLSRFLLARGQPLEEVGVADGFHPECDGSSGSLSLSTLSCPRTAPDGSWMFGARDVSFLLLCRLMVTEENRRTPTSSESEWPSAERKERWGRMRRTGRT